MTVIRFLVNAEPVEVDVRGSRRLLDVLREDLALTGTKEGCGEGECGACSVLVDGEVVDACLVAVAQVDGRVIRTVAYKGFAVLFDQDDGGAVEEFIRELTPLPLESRAALLSSVLKPEIEIY